MRIIQIIDSSEAGGAEKMAVNYANALCGIVEFSGVVITRKEGVLSNQINKNVSYLYLNRKTIFDFKALFRLRNFVIKNNIEIVQAHSTSFFFAFLLKLICPGIRLIWHDHYGDSEFLEKRPVLVLKFVRFFFNGIIVVNQNLKLWAQEKLNFENVIYLPNFTEAESNVANMTILKGDSQKRIVCLANLRMQKNHFLLLEVASKLKASHPEWTFHLIGKDFEDDYSGQIKKLILDLNLQKNVFIYGSREDINNILNQCSIAILTSLSEGLPVALLEYGLYNKPVVVTNVGEIATIIKNKINGILVPSNDSIKFYKGIVEYIENEEFRISAAEKLNITIYENYSKGVVIKKYLNWLNQ